MDTDKLPSFLLNQAIENSDTGICFLDKHGNITLANSKFLNFFGYSGSELQNLHVTEILCKEHRDEINARLAEVQSGSPSVIERKCRHKSGETVIFRIKIISVNNIDGVFENYILYVEDTAEILKNKKNHLNILNSVPVGIWITDETGKIYESNTKMCDMFGYPPEEFELINTRQLYARLSDRELLICTLEKKGNIRNWEALMCHRDGSKFFMLLNMDKSEYNGQPVYITIGSDVSERKRAEYEIKKSEEKFRAVFEGSIDGILVADGETKQFIYANPKICSMLGYSQEEITALSVKNIHPEQDIPHVVTEFEKQLKKEKRISESLPVLKKDGSVFYCDISSVPYQFENKVHLVGFFRDITDRKIADDLIQSGFEELQKAKEKAEESEKLKTAFLANISHEVRTPMNGIMGFAQILAKPDLSPEKRAHYVEIINESCHQLLSIINDILELSKIESNQVKVTLSRFNINDVMLELFSIFKPKVNEKDVGLYTKKELGDNEAFLTSDIVKFKQIFTNLISNAIKFTNKGYIEFGYKLAGDKLRFYVKDTGIGIPEDLHQKIFDRFWQVEMHLSRNYGGTGLGLTITKAFVEMLGGSIYVESKPENGTTFYFELPKQNLKQQDNPGNKPLILVAEDEFTNFYYIDEILTDNDFLTLHAKNGQEAVELFYQYPGISLVLMDIKMPVMNGYEAVAILKKIKPGIPVIALTAFAMQEDIDKCFANGFDDFISKPMNQDNLLKAIANRLNPSPG